MGDHPYWRPTCHGRSPLLEADLPWETTLIKGRPAMGDHPLISTTLIRGRHAMEVQL